MMFLDASAVVGILNRENDADALLVAVTADGQELFISPLARFEATLALARAIQTARPNPSLSRAQVIGAAKALVDKFLLELSVSELPITSDIGNDAIHAAATYGKAVGHKADLNMGDCFSYACAKSANIGLLYKGNDFSETDLA